MFEGSAAGRIAVGRINSPWGLRGHVKVTPLTSNPDRLRPGAVVFVLGEPRRITDVRTPQGYPVIQFEGYPDRTSVERLRNSLVEIEPSELHALEEDEYYIHDLIGIAVVSTEDLRIGVVEEVIETGANDVYRVRRPGAPDVLVPALKDIVREIDLDRRVMVIDVVPGLLD